MISIHELLKDRKYKEYFCQVPKLPDHFTRPGATPWRLAIQKTPHGAWVSKDYATYPEAFKKLKANLTRINDAAIICRPLAQDPPRVTVRLRGKFFLRGGKKLPVTERRDWQPKMPPGEEERHHWCPYCRRPTVFLTFIYHPILTPTKLNGMMIDPDLLRCSICGASENLVNLKQR